MGPPSDAELRDGLQQRPRAEWAGAGRGDRSGALRPTGRAFRSSCCRSRSRAGGGSARLQAARLGGAARAGARLAKPRFLHDPLREPVVYRWMLPRRRPDRPSSSARSSKRADGAGSSSSGSRGGSSSRWASASSGRRRRGGSPVSTTRWLRGCSCHRDAGRLLEHDARLLPSVDGEGADVRLRPTGRGLAGGDRVAGGRPRAGGRSAAGPAPKTVVHGEFYASNVLVAATRSVARRRRSTGSWRRPHRASPTSRRWSAGGTTPGGRRSSPPTRRRGRGRRSPTATSTSCGCRSRSSGSAGRRPSGSGRRGSGTTGRPRRSRWPRDWACERGPLPRRQRRRPRALRGASTRASSPPTSGASSPAPA